MFLQLSEDRFYETVLPSILVTAKGMPDLSTRAFLFSLTAAFPNIPVLGTRSGNVCKKQCNVRRQLLPSESSCRAAGLVDFNPSGIAILSVYKFGSFRGGLEAPRLLTATSACSS